MNQVSGLCFSWQGGWDLFGYVGACVCWGWRDGFGKLEGVLFCLRWGEVLDCFELMVVCVLFAVIFYWLVRVQVCKCGRLAFFLCVQLVFIDWGCASKCGMLRLLCSCVY